jgi:hypothetical protein
MQRTNASNVGIFLLFCALSSGAYAVSFSGTNLGLIPDDATATSNCRFPTGAGTPRVVSFAVSGLTMPVSSVGVRFLFSPQHTSVGDLHVQITAPGGSPSMTIFGNAGASLAFPSGSIGNAKGPYDFSDTQTGDWWNAAANTDNLSAIPAGGYRTGADNSSAATSLNATFGGVTAIQANGTWTLSFSDDCVSDSGSVESATLFINDTSMPVRLENFEIE